MNTKQSLFLVAALLFLKVGILINPVLAQDDAAKKKEVGLFTNVYVVPPTFMELSGESKTRPTAKNILESAGIFFAPGCSVVYNVAKSQLIVRNTQDQMELVEAYIESINRVEKQIYITVRFVKSDSPIFLDPVKEKANGSEAKKKGESDSDVRFVESGHDMLKMLESDDMAAMMRKNAGPRIVPANDIVGVFTDPQFQIKIRELSQKKGIDFLNNSSWMIRSGQQILFRYADFGLGLDAVIGADGFTLDLVFYSREFVDKEGGLRKISTVQVTIWDGQTVAKERKLPDGSYLTEFITAQIMDPAGLPIHGHGHIVDEEREPAQKAKKKPSSNPVDLTPQQIVDVKEADELALKGSQLMAEGHYGDAQDSYLRALRLLPDKEIAKQREKAYAKQFLRALQSEKGKEREAGLFTNTYVVPPSFQVDLGPESRPKKLSVQEMFELAGVTFGPGCSAIYSIANSTVIVRNTQEQMEIVEECIEAFLANVPDRQIYLTVRFVESDVSMASTHVGFPTDKPPTISSEVDIKSSVSEVEWESDMVNILGAEDMAALTREGVAPRIVPVSAITAVYTNPQFQFTIKELSQEKEFDIFVAPSLMIRSGQQTIFRHDDRGLGVKVGLRADEFTLDLSIFSREAADGKGGLRKISRQNVTIWDGQTIVLERKLPEGRYRIEFVTAQIMDPSGLPIHGHIVDEEREPAQKAKKKPSSNPGDLTPQQ